METLKISRWYYIFPIIILCCMLLYCWLIYSSPQTVFLVRHADKQGVSDDLSAAGEARALELSRVLGEANIVAIYASQYIRTQKTAAPLATSLGLTVTLYNANDLPALANLIKSNHYGQNVLVVGHSNTVPITIGLLGISPQPSNIPEHEYDHLYVLTRHSKIINKLIKLRYGAS